MPGRKRILIGPSLLLLSVLLAQGCRPEPYLPKRQPGVIDLVFHFPTAQVSSRTECIDLGEPEARDRLVSGWSWDERPDRSFVWAMGDSSSLRLLVHEPRDLELTMVCRTLPQLLPQQVQVSVNGIPVGELGVSNEWQSYQVQVPAAALVPGDNLVELSYQTVKLGYVALPESGDIRPLADVDANEVDAVLLPGGFGAAKNLCTFAVDGADCTVHTEVESFLRAARTAHRPLGAMCIAPVILARIFGSELKPKLTIGTDPDTAAAITAMGAEHVDCNATGIVVDEANRIVTTPAYMLAGNIAEVFDGAETFVRKLLVL